MQSCINKSDWKFILIEQDRETCAESFGALEALNGGTLALSGGPPINEFWLSEIDFLPKKAQYFTSQKFSSDLQKGQKIFYP